MSEGDNGKDNGRKDAEIDKGVTDKKQDRQNRDRQTRGRAVGFIRDTQYAKFCAYGFLKNLRFFDPFFMLFLLERGMSFLQIGTLYAAKEIAINILEIPTGVVADALGRRRTMIMSFLSYIISFVVFYSVSSFPMFILAIILFAFGDAFRTGTHKSMIFEYLKLNGWEDQKTAYYGNTRSWSQKGSALSAVIAAGLVFWRGNYSTVFLFSIVPYLADLALMITYPKVLDGDSEGRPKGVGAVFGSVLKDFVSSFRNPLTFKAMGNQALMSGYFKACKDYLQPLLNAVAVGLPVLTAVEPTKRSALLVGVVYSVLYMITSTASARSGRFLGLFRDRSTPMNLTLVGGLLLGAAGGLLHYFGLSAVAILLYMGIYINENLRKPMGIAYVSDLMNPRALATALSAESQAETLFAAVIAFAVGAVSHSLGVGAGLAIVTLGLIPVAFLFRTKRIPRDHTS